MNFALSMRAARWVILMALSSGIMSISCAARHRANEAESTHWGRMARLPRLTVWSWERREDLRDLDVRTTALAYLDRTLQLDRQGMRAVPRREAMLLPASAGLARIAVVRIEVELGAQLGEVQAEAVVRELAKTAAEPGLAALQIDFDARRSERLWYADVLRSLRARMPSAMPLSITALASWCSYDGEWMRNLPVDEAVPMLFRMEPDRKRLGASADRSDGDFAIRQPVCQGSVGISTRERWPRDLQARRVYVFADRGWARDGLQETMERLR